MLKTSTPSIFGYALCAALALGTHTAMAQAVPIVNAGFEESIKSWETSQHAGEIAYEFAFDSTTAPEGKRSYRVTRTKRQVYGSVNQRVSVPGPGKYQLSALLRTKEVTGRGWALYATAYANNGIIDIYRSEPLTGTQDWGRVTLSFDAPEGTSSMVIGASLRGDGTGWLDDVKLERIKTP